MEIFKAENKVVLLTKIDSDVAQNDRTVKYLCDYILSSLQRIYVM